jgi:methylmalonyl-CoA mutase cobalamin-binding subunit
VTYLGPNLPAREIADAVRRSRAQALAVSVIYPADDPLLNGEFLTLRTMLGAKIPILVGGRSVSSYAEALTQIDATVVGSLHELSTALQSCRQL